MIINVLQIMSLTVSKKIPLSIFFEIHIFPTKRFLKMKKVISLIVVFFFTASGHTLCNHFKGKKKGLMNIGLFGPIGLLVY